ncbi:MAG: hypothetical protein KGI02_09560 [Thaumarchaeota archaeon]|nr:hypothetical protein [Nitrososphaerota archaeon]
MINKILKMFSDQCEYAKECQFYDNNNYDQYYKSDMLCEIKREKDVVKLGTDLSKAP